MALLLAPVLVCAEDSPAAGKKIEHRFPAEIERKVAELMKKLGEEKSKIEAAQLKQEIAEMVKTTGLDEAGQKTLEKPAAAAVESASREWAEKIEALCRTNWDGMSAELLDQWIAQGAALQNNFWTDYVRSAEQPAWTAALAQVLDPKQAAAWKAIADERRRKFDEESKGVISAAKESARELAAQTLSGTVTAIEMTLSLDEAGKKKLEKLADVAADKASDFAKEKARRRLLSFDEITRRQVLKTIRLYIPPDENNAPEEQAVWKDGLKELLTAEETRRWEAAVERRGERRLRELSRLFVWTFDQAAAFTASQREQLQPVVDRLVRDHADLFPEYRANPNFNVQSLYEAATHVKEGDLEKILDAKQVERWKALSSRQPGRSRAGAKRFASPPAAEPWTKPVPFEPEDLEAAVSDYFSEAADRQQDRALDAALLRVEDAVRVAGVNENEKAARRLRTAARGAVERDLEAWKASTETQIRGQLEDATPADFRQRAANVTQFASAQQLRAQSGSAAKGIWEAAVAAELTGAQRAAWQKEIDARKAYEQQTIVANLVEEFDRLCMLTDEQWGKLEPLLAERMKDYGPEFEQMFGNWETPWFLQNYCLLTPVAGIPEKEMRKILTDEQWKHWTFTSQFGNGSRYWGNIESNHKQRIERAEKKP